VDIKDQLQNSATMVFTISNRDQVGLVPSPTSIEATKQSKHLNISARNVQSCKTKSTLLLLPRELLKYRVNICCVSETRMNEFLSKKPIINDTFIFQFYNLCPSDALGCHIVRFFVYTPTESRISRISFFVTIVRLRGRISLCY